MKRYVVFQCRNCGLPQLARNDRKSRECVRCSVVNPVDYSKIKVLFQTDDMKEALAAVQYAKMNRDVFPFLKLYRGRDIGFLRKVNRV